jgi:hypothetical protein
MLQLRSHRSALLPLGALAIAAALSACGQDNQPSVSTGSAEVSVQPLSSVPLGQVTVTITGPALPNPKPVILSAQGSGGSYGALISSLPVGSNYTFTVSATDTSDVVAYVGQATNVAILHNHVTTVVITAQPVQPPAPFVNTVPVIDSLVVSSTNIAPGETITAKVTAHDDQPSDTITFAWSANPASGSFSAPTATTTAWTAPSTEGDVTLAIQVQDDHGATTSASIVIHVSNSNGKGQADVNVTFNNWPVVTDVLATPGWIALGAPVSLSVTASDSDGDTLSYLWSTGTTCTSGSFTNATSATTMFILPASAPDGYCEFDVAVSDGHGGSAHGTMYLPVGAPASIIAPAIVDAAQSASVVDPSSTVLFSVEAMDPQASTMTFVWSTTGGTLSGQSDTGTTSQVTLTAPATASSDVVVSVVVTDAVGASKQYDFSAHTAAVTTACTPPASTAWKFGMMSDTQWTTADPAGQNPTTVSVSIINQLNPIFIQAGVKFVIQVGDLADTGNDADEIVRAQAAQPLYDAGIGFYPMRGNHETYGTANSFAIPVFQTSYPQTRGLSNTFGATNFSSPTSLSTELDGMTYSFDYNNARFVILDTWATPSIDISAAGYSYGYSVAQQQPWINSRLDKTTRGTDHAFVLSHQPLMAESHQDTMFQGYTNANPDMQNAFYASLQSNNVKYFLAGHDHMNQHSIMASPDGLSSVHEIIGASDSSKFYTPSAVSGANWFGQKVRETPVAQELYTVGYYIFTVDGPNVTVDFYSDSHGNWKSDASYPMGAGNASYPINITPVLTFAKKQTFGYSQNGAEFLVAEGASYPTTPFTFSGTTAQFLAGTNTSTAMDYISRKLTHAVDIGWDAATCATSSAILSLWGTTDIGSSSGDTIALSMSFDRNSVSDATLVSGNFGLAAVDSAGNLTSAVAQNVGGTPNFVFGPWNASYTLGTYGVDPDTNTVWAVVNHAGRFAAGRF